MMISNQDATRSDQLIRAFISDIVTARDALSVDVPGWTLRQPTVSDTEIAFIIAESKEGAHLPFVLPSHTASCLCVTDGAVALESGGVRSALAAPMFYVLSDGVCPQIISLEHPTKVVCLFFRSEGLSGGFAMDSR